MRIQFNTNRQYSPEGQPIVGEYKPAQKMMYFADLARSVHGRFRLDYPGDHSAMRQAIMNNYDQGIYEHTASTFEFFNQEKIRAEKPAPSKSKKALLDLLEKLEYRADDIRAELEDINPAEDLEFKDPSSANSYLLDEAIEDLYIMAGALSQDIQDLKKRAEEVTK